MFYIGDYVLMVQDVTSPPVLGCTLQPAFLLLKLKRPKREKIKKTQGPKYVFIMYFYIVFVFILCLTSYS